MIREEAGAGSGAERKVSRGADGWMVGSQFWPDCLQAARAIESQREDDFFSPLGFETDRSEAMGQISDTPSSVSFWIKSSIEAGLIRAWPKRMREAGREVREVERIS